jgi:hypothetical protein
MREPPLRLLLGNMAFDSVTAAHRRQLEEWARYETLTRSADADDSGSAMRASATRLVLH